MIAERIQKNGHCISIIILKLLLLSITIDAQELGGWIDGIYVGKGNYSGIITYGRPLVSNLYNQLSGASDMIKGFASGIALGAGISI